MSIKIDQKLLRLIASVEDDISKVISEALKLWLRTKILVCPMNNELCEKSSCNNCLVLKQSVNKSF
jgi:hypothetical protein